MRVKIWVKATPVSDLLEFEMDISQYNVPFKVTNGVHVALLQDVPKPDDSAAVGEFAGPTMELRSERNPITVECPTCKVPSNRVCKIPGTDCSLGYFHELVQAADIAANARS